MEDGRTEEEEERKTGEKATETRERKNESRGESGGRRACESRQSIRMEARRKREGPRRSFW